MQRYFEKVERERWEYCDKGVNLEKLNHGTSKRPCSNKDRKQPDREKILNTKHENE